MYRYTRAYADECMHVCVKIKFEAILFLLFCFFEQVLKKKKLNFFVVFDKIGRREKGYNNCTRMI